MASNITSTCEGSVEESLCKFYKSARGKNTYYLKKRQLDLDCDKLNIMKSLNENLEESKNFQKENFIMWNERMKEINQTLKERNEILKEVAKVLKEKIH